MPDSKREQVLAALLAALGSATPAGATLLRNAVLPERIPTAGLMILRDGDPGEPDSCSRRRAGSTSIGPRSTCWSPGRRRRPATPPSTGCCRRSVRRSPPTARSAASSTSPSARRRRRLDLPVEGAEGLKAATIGVVLPYDTGDPLG